MIVAIDGVLLLAYFGGGRRMSAQAPAHPAGGCSLRPLPPPSIHPSRSPAAAVGQPSSGKSNAILLACWMHLDRHALDAVGQPSPRRSGVARR